MINPWIVHVRKYAKDNNLTYACAIPYAKGSYIKKDGTQSSPSKISSPPKPEPKATPKPKAKAKALTKKQIKEEEQQKERERISKEREESNQRHRKLIQRLDKETQKKAELRFEEGERQRREQKGMFGEDPIQQRIQKQKDDERKKKMEAEKEKVLKSVDRSRKIMRIRQPEIYREPIRKYFNLAEQYYKMLDPKNLEKAFEGAETPQEINTKIKQISDNSNAISDKMKEEEQANKDIKNNMNEAENDILKKALAASRGFKRRIDSILRKKHLKEVYKL
jgi:hypothetical protein